MIFQLGNTSFFAAVGAAALPGALGVCMGGTVREHDGSFRRAEEHYLSQVTVLVLGSGPFWTQQTCGHIETQFDTVSLRLDAIDNAVALSGELTGLRLVIVDQRMSEDLLARTPLYVETWPAATVALAYRRAEVARDFHARFDHARFGAMAYLPMSSPFDVWLSSIRLLLHREHFLPSDLRETVRPKPAAPPALPRVTEVPTGTISGLTDRETEVLRLASAGDSNKAISRKLGISEHTVKLHMHHVYAKLGVSNRTAAASLLLANGRPG